MLFNFFFVFQSDKADAGPESRSKVPYVPAVRLVIAAAQEYFNSAQNSKDSILDLARQCLNLMEDKSPQIMAELDLISSLPILEGMNVTRLLPIQVRLTADKTDLIKAVLNADTNAYKNLEQILKLAKLLRVDGEDKNKSRGKILVLCAGKALEHQDYKKTAEYCGEIMRLRYEPGWSICQQLGLCEKFKNREVRLDLFTFAMAYCEETTALQTLTEYIRSLKLELVMNDLE